MTARHLSGLLLAAAVLALSACGESPQTQGGRSAAKRDTAPHTGGSAAVFTKDGWKAGDANSWAQQLKARAQYGMNDHQRVVTP